jgi:imidazolonepropionase
MIVYHSAAQIVTPTSTGQFRIIDHGAIVSDGESISFVGSTNEALHSFPSAAKVDVSGKVIVPGFVDAHTHLLYGGDRCAEFLMRLRGATYQEIAAAGGGIQHTVRETRVSSEEQLFQQGLSDLEQMLATGTTTVEVKSGYGLNWENEKKLLSVAAKLQKHAHQDLTLTFLGAHDFPPEKSREEYLREISDVMIPEVANNRMAEFCDVFCDQGYYTADETRAICRKAAEFGLKIKLHVDELADVHGAALAAELKAVSADHLILANEEGIRKMADAGVCAVLLPGTSFSLKTPQHAPARKMIQHGVKVALATDFNPGTCYSHSMFYILQLAPLLYRMTAEETLTAATLNGAAAIAKQDQLGSLEPGKQMDCLIFNIPQYGYLFYNLGVNRLETVLKKGKVAWSRK